MQSHRRSKAARALRSRSQAGFTLIELLVVITILGILAAIVVFAVNGIGDKGKSASVATDASVLRTAEEVNCAKNGSYGTIDDLLNAKFLATRPTYNAVSLSDDGVCGTGPKSSFSIFDASASTQFVPGKDQIGVGSGPADIAVDPGTNRVYVANAGDGTVSVIDGKTDAVLPPAISVVSTPTRIAVNPSNHKVYVGGTNGVTVIDPSTPTPTTHTIDLDFTVDELGIDPDDGDVYVGADNEISYVTKDDDTTAHGVNLSGITCTGPAGPKTCTPRLPGSFLPATFVFDPTTHKVFAAKEGVANNGGGAPNFNAAFEPGLITIDSAHNASARVFASGNGSNTAPANSLIGNSVQGLAVDPTTHKIYLMARRLVPFPANVSGVAQVGIVLVIDEGDGSSTSVDDFPSSSGTATPASSVDDPNTGTVYIQYAGSGDDNAACNGAGGRIVAMVGASVVRQGPACTPANPNQSNPTHDLAFDPNIDRVFATTVLAAGGGILPLDGGTLLSQAPLGTPREFTAFAVNTTTNKIYVVDTNHGNVAVLQLTPST